MKDFNINEENEVQAPITIPVIPEIPEIPEKQEFVPNQVVVKFNPQISQNEVKKLQQQLDAEVLENINPLGIQLWSISDKFSVDETVESLSGDARVEFIEPNYIYSTQATFPNDSSFSNEWGLHNTGQTGGTADADIDAPEAWDFGTGSSNVVVGVIDTGIDYTHPDLDDNIWTNPGEIANDGIDNDGNGYVDDINGWDFVNNDNDPFDDNGHGTHVAGTIAAEGNNGIGVTGVNWDASLMALKFLGSGGGGTSFDAVQAIQYATDNGADLTNNSWGGGGFSQAILTAIQNAQTEDVLFVAAAGNATNNNDVNPSYPASYTLDNIISVASTDHNDQLSSFSNYGETSVDLGAPGSSIYSTYPGGIYASLSGTSMASPHVAGAASLILSQDPSLTSAQVKDTILNRAEAIPALNGITLTGDRLNLANAFQPAGGTISGIKWNDLNGDGEQDINEPGLQGWTIYLDQNQNGQFDNGETSTTTDANGNYSFTNLAADTYYVAEVLQSGWEQTFPNDMVLTFDDISTLDSAPIPDGYGGLSWSDDFSYINAPNVVPGTGYDNGRVSGDYVAFNGGATPVEVSSNDAFDFNSSYLTAAWNDNLDVEVEGLLNGVQKYNQSVTVNPDAPTLFNFDFEEVDQLRFTSSGGTDADPNDGGLGEHFVLDDLSLSTSGIHTVNLAEGETVTDIDFGNRRVIGRDKDEPNDTIEEAIDSGIDGSGIYFDKGFIGDNPNVAPSDDVDLIELELNAGGRAIIDIDAREYGSSLDSVLRLFDSDGNEVAVSDDTPAYDEYFFTRDSFLDFTASVSDTYYVGVSSYSNFNYDYLTEGSGSGNTTGEYDISIVVEEPVDNSMAETGSISNLTDTPVTINLARDYENPVVFAQPLSFNGSAPATVRLDNITSDSFTVSVQEPNNEDGSHAAENLSYMVLEAGEWELVDGTILEVGTIDSNQQVAQGWETVNFDADFDNTPVVMSQIQTLNGADFVRTRQDDITENGFLVGMEEEEANKNTGHANETIGYMAISGGSGNWSGLNYTAGYTGDNVTEAWKTQNFTGFSETPQLLASLASYDGADPAGIRYQNLSNNQVELKVEEDTSVDAEMAHTTENVSFLAIEGTGILDAVNIDSLTGTSNSSPVLPDVTNLEATESADTFILGDASEAFYDNMGTLDYALINGFDSSEDIIRLHGSASDYQLGAAPEELPQGTGIFLKNATSDELVAVVSEVSDLALDADYFSFV